MPRADGTAPPGSDAAFDAGWLGARRWFRSKQRALAAVTVEDAMPLGPAPRAGLVVLRASFADGGEERYLVVSVTGDDGALREARPGDGAWAAVVALMAGDADLAGATGRFSFRALPALDELLDGDHVGALAEHQLDVEQSNTSIRLGDRLMLKLYRLLELGINPEVEVNRFLGEVGFRWAPRLAGVGDWLPASGEGSAAAMLQELVPARGDGWTWMLNGLASPPLGSQQTLAAAAQIGGITAEMHAALASRPDRPAFPAGAASPAERLAWRASAERQLDGALASVAGPELERLEAVSDRIRQRFEAMEAADGALSSRIHGDYHLGQLLRTETGFVVVDFEGEPARSLDERRRPSSPLRDVAGMLRSFDYAVRTAQRNGSDRQGHDAWLDDARSAFLGAYGPAATRDAPLLAAFEAEKACYEVRYEANNRPGWIWLPLEALERLAA